MSEKEELRAPKPLVKQGYWGLLSIWLIPLLAVGIAAWLILKSYINEGPEISVLLSSAKGIEAGVTEIRYRDVAIGTVDRIEITDELDGARVFVSMQKRAEKYLTDTARIWVVSPAISLDGIKGLDTLLSGSYLEIDRGREGSLFGSLRASPVRLLFPPPYRGGNLSCGLNAWQC